MSISHASSTVGKQAGALPATTVSKPRIARGAGLAVRKVVAALWLVASGMACGGTNSALTAPVVDVIQVVGGVSHTCALTTDRGVMCWGSSAYGALGDNGVVQHHTSLPVAVVGLENDEVVALTAGNNFTCALTATGAVKCWGGNNNGQLGDGTEIRRDTAVEVVGLGGPVQAIAAGYQHACAITAGDGMKCWGRNEDGELGNNSTVNSSTPVHVFGLASGVVAIDAGHSFTCAVTDTGTAKCWGDDMYQQLGSDVGDSHVPADVTNLSSGVAEVTTGGYHACALMAADGSVMCWGSNAYGTLGAGTTNYRSDVPLAVAYLYDVVEVAATTQHSCALTATGQVGCWGDNNRGQLGVGSAGGFSSTPMAVYNLGESVVDLAAGQAHTCAVGISGLVRCWGYNYYGQLGDGTTEERYHPTVVDFDTLFRGGFED